MSLRRQTFRLFLSILLLPAPVFATAYPDGYPRSDQQRVLDAVDLATDRPGRHRGGLRIAANREDEEYLIAWLTEDGIRAIRLDGNTLLPVAAADGNPSTPFQVVRIVEDDRVPNPLLPDLYLIELTDFDIAFDSERNSYFLAAKVQSREDDDTSNVPTHVFGGYLSDTFQSEIANWEAMNEGSDVANRSGVRVFEVDYVTSTSMHVFWNQGDAVQDIFTQRAGSVRGRVVTGNDASGNLTFGTPPTTLLEVADKTANGANTFSLRDLAIGYDPHQRRFLVAATLAEAMYDTESGNYFLLSHVVASAVNQGMTLPGGTSTSYRIISLDTVSAVRSHIDLSAFPKSATFSYLWPYYSPQVVLGQKEGSGLRHWLIAFNKKYDIDNRGDGLATFRQAVFAQRIHLTAGGGVDSSVDDEERLLGGYTELFPDPVQMGTDVSSAGKGLWLSQLGRFLVPGTVDGAYADTISDASGIPSRSEEAMNLFHDGMFMQPPHGVQIISSLDGERVYALAETSGSLILQPLELRWQDMSISADRTDGIDALPMDGTTTIRLGVNRATSDFVVNVAAGTFDSGAYTVHITLPPGVSLEPAPHISGNAEDGYFINGAAFTSGIQNHDLILRNANPTTSEQILSIAFALEGATDRFDFNSANDGQVVELTIEGNPDGVDPTDPGDTEPGDGDGGDDGDTDPGDGDGGDTDPGDGDGGDGGDTDPGNGDGGDGGDTDPGDGDGGDTDPGDGDGGDGGDTDPGDGDGGDGGDTEPGDGDGSDGGDTDPGDGDDTGNLPPEDDDENDGGKSGGGGALGWLLLGLAGFAARRRRVN